MRLQDVLHCFPVPDGYADHLNKCKLFQIDSLINTLVDASTWSIYQLPDQVASWLLWALQTLKCKDTAESVDITSCVSLR